MKVSFLKSANQYVSLIVISLLSAIVVAEMDTDVPTGWAVVPSSVGKPPAHNIPAVENTIGGGNGRVVTASGSEIGKYAASKEPLVILASGSCGSFTVASNKTIIGVGEGLTVKGGLGVDKVSNVILRNIRISGGVDAISVAYGSHHVWIDHCDVSACSDGLIDMKRGADRISISWVRFSDHHKTMLINNGAKNTNDEGRLNITLNHNFWDGSNTRNPRAGYGQIHVLNCYYKANSGYGIHVYWNSELRIERNYFENVKDAISDHKEGKQGDWPGPGYVVLIDNYTSVKGSIKKTTTTDPDRIFNVEKVYMYDWMVIKDVMQVPDVVKSGASTGSKWGRIGAIPTPGQGCVSVSTNPTLEWTKVGSDGEIPATSKVYFGTTNPPPEAATVEGYSYKPGKLKDGTVYYWKINDGKVWTFRTNGDIPLSTNNNKIKLIKNTVSPKATPVVNINTSGKSSDLIGVKDGKNSNSVYLMNGKEYIRESKTRSAAEKEAVK